MTENSDFLVDEGIATLRISNPPGNTLSYETCNHLYTLFATMVADDRVTGIILTGENGVFSTGAEVQEYDRPRPKRGIRQLCDLIEGSDKPVVAVLEGNVVGGGFELALAAHARVALRTCSVAMPEVRIGLPPSAGASQRLPRFVGAECALDILLNGRMEPVERADLAPVFDKICMTEAYRTACDVCRDLVSSGFRKSRNRRDGFADPAAYGAAVEAARKAVASRVDPLLNTVISLVEAAPLLPFEAGVSMEDDAFAEASQSDRSRALRHVLIAERIAPRVSLSEQVRLPSLDCIAVLGGGSLAVQIVLSCLNAGLRVQWGTKESKPLQEGLAQVRQVFEKGVDGGGVPRSVAEARLARLKTGGSVDMVTEADMVIHAARGQVDVPVPETIVRASAMPSRVEKMGLRFAPPVFATRLVEVVHGAKAEPRHIAAGVSLARKLGKVAVHVRSDGESASGRLSLALHRALDALIDAGASPYKIDEALVGHGWAKPLFQVRDLRGLEDFAKTSRVSGSVNWSKAMLEAGRPGVSGGLGFYVWDNGAARPDIEVTAILDDARQPAVWDRNDICTLVVGALANEGARMLRDRTVQRASDIDVLSVLGLDMPRASGGPMAAATHIGLFRLQMTLQRFNHPDRAFWDPDPLWSELVKNGKTFIDV